MCGGGHGLINCDDKKNSMPFVLGKAKTVMNTLFPGCLSRSELQVVAVCRLWGLIKPNSC